MQQCFSNIGETSQQKTQKKVNPRNADANVVFSTSIFNSLRPNLNKIMNKNIHVLLTNDNLRKLYPKGRILFVNKMKKNLEQLLMWSGQYNKKDDQWLSVVPLIVATKILTPAKF